MIALFQVKILGHFFPISEAIWVVSHSFPVCELRFVYLHENINEKSLQKTRYERFWNFFYHFFISKENPPFSLCVLGLKYLQFVLYFVTRIPFLKRFHSSNRQVRIENKSGYFYPEWYLNDSSGFTLQNIQFQNPFKNEIYCSKWFTVLCILCYIFSEYFHKRICRYFSRYNFKAA